MPQFDLMGSDDIMTGPAIITGSSARSIFIALNEISSGGSYDAPMDLTSSVPGAGTNYAITNEVAVRVSGNRVFNEGIVTGQDSVLTITNAASDNVSSTLAYINGTLLTQNSTSGNALNTHNDGMRIGQAAFASSECNCDIAEIIIYNEELSPTDRAAVEQYLYNKYSISP